MPRPSAAPTVGAWRSLVARIVRDDEVGGSNPLAPTKPTSSSSCGSEGDCPTGTPERGGPHRVPRLPKRAASFGGGWPCRLGQRAPLGMARRFALGHATRCYDAADRDDPLGGDGLGDTASWFCRRGTTARLGGPRRGSTRVNPERASPNALSGKAPVGALQPGDAGVGKEDGRDVRGRRRKAAADQGRLPGRMGGRNRASNNPAVAAPRGCLQAPHGVLLPAGAPARVRGC